MAKSAKTIFKEVEENRAIEKVTRKNASDIFSEVEQSRRTGVSSYNTPFDRNTITDYFKRSNDYASSAYKELQGLNWGNSASSYFNRLDSLHDLQRRADAIRSYYKTNRASMSASDYDKMMSAIDEAEKSNRSVADAFSNAANEFHIYNSEEDFNTAVKEKWENYRGKMNADLDALNKEIADLENIGIGLDDPFAQQTEDVANRIPTQVDPSVQARISAVGEERAAAAQVLKEKRQYRDDVQKIQNVEKWVQMKDLDPDFNDYAKSGRDLENNRITNALGRDWTEDVKQRIQSNADTLGTTGAGQTSTSDEEFLFQHLTSDEYATYSYLLQKEANGELPEGTADQFYADLLPTARERQGYANYESTLKGDALAEVMFSAVAGLGQFSTGTVRDIDAILGTRFFSDPTTVEIMSGLARADVATTGPSIFGKNVNELLYDAGVTGWNMVPHALTSMLTAGLLGSAGIAEDTARRIGEKAGLTAMGMSVAGNSYAEAVNAGFDPTQARFYAALTGAAEAKLQELIGSLPGLRGVLSETAVKKFSEGLSNAGHRILAWAVRNGGNALLEANEEGLQEILKPYFIALTTGSKPEAVDWEEVFYSAIMGAMMSAGGSVGEWAMNGTANVAVNTANVVSLNNAANRAIKEEYSGDMSSIIEELNASENAKNRGLAQDIQRAQDKGRELSGRQVRKAVEAADVEKIKNAAIEQLKANGESGDVNAIASALAKEVSGRRLSKNEAALINNSEAANKVRSGIVSAVYESDRAGGDWFRNVGTRYIQKRATNTGDYINTDVAEERAQAATKLNPELYKEVKTRGESVNDDVTPVRIIEQNGKRAVANRNGEAITPEDIEYADAKEAQVLSYLVAAKDLSVSEANQLYEMAMNEMKTNEDFSPAKFFMGAEEAIRYGYLSPSDAQKSASFFNSRLEKGSVYYAALPENVRQYLYESGRNKRSAKVESAQNVFDENRARFGDAELTNNGKVYIGTKDGNAQEYKGNLESMTGITGKQKTAVDFAVRLLQPSTGGNIYFYRSQKNAKGEYRVVEGAGRIAVGAIAENGMYVKGNGDIYIDLNSGANGRGVALYTLGHEMTHFIQEWSPKRYKVLEDYVIEQLGRTGHDIEELIRAEIEASRRNKRVKTLTYDQAREEVIADAMSSIFTDGNIDNFIKNMEAIRQRDGALWNKIREFFKKSDFAKRLKNAYGEENPDREVGRTVKEMTEYFDNIQKYFAEALAEAGENFQIAQVQKHTETEAKEIGVPAEQVETLQKNGLAISNQAVVAENVAAIMNSDEYAPPMDEDSMYSYRSTPEWKRKMFAKYGYTRETVRYIKAIEAFNGAMISDDAVRGFAPMGSYQSVGLGPLRSNQEYIVSFDLDTSCPRTFQFLYFRDRIEAVAKRPLTYFESVNLLELMRDFGQNIPCSYCYVENKRVLLAASYNNFINYRRAVLSEADANKAMKLTYGYNEKTGKLSEASQEMFDKWRSDMSFNPTVQDVWSETHKARNYVFNLLDAMLAEKKVSPTANEKELGRIVNDYFGVTNKSAQSVLRSYAEEWAYDAYSGTDHKSIVENDGTIGKIDERLLEVDYDALSYAKSASSANIAKQYVPYSGELMDLMLKDPNAIKNINAHGGLRKHSSNDFRIDYVQDYFMLFADMAMAKLFGHTYTKSAEYVKIFGRTGDRINMSIAMTDDSHGNVYENKLEGMAWNEVKALRKAYKNAGAMAMVTSDAQLSYALNADWIDMIIPFHASSLDKRVWYNLRAWFDYTSTQHERLYNTQEKRLEILKKRLTDAGVEFSTADMEKKLLDAAKKEGAGLGAKSRSAIIGAEIKRLKALAKENKVTQNIGKNTQETNDIYENEIARQAREALGIEQFTKKNKKGEVKVAAPTFLVDDQNIDGQIVPGHHNDVERYKTLCKAYGVHPRFEGVAVADADGNTVDITNHPGYLKVLKETARTDSEQTAIEFNFDEVDPNLGMSPMDYAIKAMREQADLGGYEGYKTDDYHLIETFIDKYLGKDRPLGWKPNTIIGGNNNPNYRATAAVASGSEARKAVYSLPNAPKYEFEKSPDVWSRGRSAETQNSTREEDAEYLRLAKDPKKNESALRRLVQKAARAAGYTVETYHGTTNFGFTQIDPLKGDDGISFFVTDDIETAQTYTKRSVNPRLVWQDVNEDSLAAANDFLRSGSENLLEEAGKYVKDKKWLEGFVGDFVRNVKREAELGNDEFFEENLHDLADYMLNSIWEKSESGVDFFDWKENAKDLAWDVELLTHSAYGYHNSWRDKGNEGIYHLYVNPDGLLEVDANGSNWAHIKFTPEDLKDAVDRGSRAEEVVSRFISDPTGGQYTEEELSRAEDESRRFRALNNEFTSKYGFGLGADARTREIAKYAYDAGYPGVAIRNVLDNGGRNRSHLNNPATVYILFNPQAQVKSADPVTYDADGNVVPLSERFNPENDDIRWSQRDEYEEYMELAEAPQKNAPRLRYMVAHEAAIKGFTPLELLHGTPKFGFTKIDKRKLSYNAFFTTPSLQMAKSYGSFGKDEIEKRTINPKAEAVADDGLLKESAIALSNAIANNTSVELGDRFSEENLIKYADDIIDRVEKGETVHVWDVMSADIYDYINNREALAWAWSDQADNVLGALSELINQVDNQIKAKTGKTQTASSLQKGGIYSLYANLDNMLYWDAQGNEWLDLIDTIPEDLREDYMEWATRNGVDTDEVITDDITRYAEDFGFDGVVFMNIYDYGDDRFATGAGDVYAFFDPENQLRSADIVTYDDYGNVIPLEDRFDVSSKELRWSTRDDDVDYNRTALLKESTVDKYLKDYASKGNPNYAQAYVVRMRPEQFIDLTTSTTGRYLVYKTSRNLDVNNLQKVNLDQPIFLRIDTETGEVTGHEGRHRAVALMRSGVTDIPVLLFDSSNKESKTPISRLTLVGQDFGSSRSEAITSVLDVQPLSYGNRDAVVQMLTTQPSTEKMMEKYGMRETVQWSTRSDDYLERVLLSKALETATVKPIEAKKIKEYQSIASRLDIERRDIDELRRELDETTDKEKAAELRAKINSLRDNIERNDKKLLTITAMKPIREILQSERERYTEQMREQAEEERARRQNLIEKRVQAVGKEHYRPRIEKIVKELDTLVNNRNAKQHVPEAFAQVAAEFLSHIDFRTYDKTGALRAGAANEQRGNVLTALTKLSNELAKQSIEAKYGQLDLPDEMMNWITTMRESLENRFAADHTFTVTKMNAQELADLYKILRTLRASLRNLGKMYTDKATDVSDLGNEALSYMEPLFINRGTKGNALGKAQNMTEGFFEWNTANPATIFKRFGEAGWKVFRGLMGGQRQMAKDVNDIEQFADKAYTKEEVNDWRNRMMTAEVNGKSLRAPVSYWMDLYATMHDPDGRKHLTNGGGGFRFADVNETRESAKYNGDNKEFRGNRSYGVEYMTPEEYAKIESMLSERQKKVALEVKEYMAKTGGTWGNQVSMTRFGYEAFGNENYYPLTTIKKDSDYDAQQKRANLYALLNKSFTKERKEGANNALVIQDMFQRFSDHMSEMALYHSFSLPVIDTIKWLNYKDPEVREMGKTERSIQEYMRRAYGGVDEKNFAYESVRRLLEDLNSQNAGGLSEEIAFINMRMVNRTRVAANLRVAIQQPFSITRALETLNGRYLKLLKPADLKAAYNEMVENSSFGLWKALGYYDVNVSTPLSQKVLKDDTFADRATEAGLKLAEKGDQFTWATLWNAVKNEQTELNRGKNLSKEALMEKIRDRFDDIIVETQIADSVLIKSEWMRSKKWYHKMTSAFMSEPIATYNMLLRRFDAFKRDARMYGKGEAIKRNARGIMKTAAVFGLTQFINALVTAPLDAARDEDDYNTYIEKMLANLGRNTVENLNPAQLLPYVNDVVSYYLYGSTNRTDMALFTQAIDLANQISSLTKEYSVRKLHKVFKTTLETASALSGIPMSNVARDVISIWNTAVAPVNEKELMFKTKADKNSVAYDKMYGYLVDGDYEKADGMLAKLYGNSVDGTDIFSGLNKRVMDDYEAGKINRSEAERLLRQIIQILGREEGKNEINNKLKGYKNSDAYAQMYGYLVDGDYNRADDVLAKLSGDSVEDTSIFTGLNTLVKNDYKAGKISRSEAEYRLRQIIQILGREEKTNEIKNKIDGWN